MELDIWDMSETERMYAYDQSQQIKAQTGCIGHMRGDLDDQGRMYSAWTDQFRPEKTQEFKDEFQELVTAFREDERYGGLLKDRKSLKRFCSEHEAGAFGDGLGNYGIRADSKKYSYLVRLNPREGMYSVYIYCYRKDYLDSHMKEAEKGIRFIDSGYFEKFRLADGGKVRITYSDGSREELTCRYVDETHVEIGRNLLHICQFAEYLERDGAKVEPVTGVMGRDKRKENVIAGIDR